MKKQFIWRFYILGGFELLGLYWNIAGDSVDSTQVKAGITVFDGLTLALCKDDHRYYLNGICTLVRFN